MRGREKERGRRERRTVPSTANSFASRPLPEEKQLSKAVLESSLDMMSCHFCRHEAQEEEE